jgi:hypothetical protein
MKLEEKSLEDLQSCNIKIQDEIRKKKDEKILSEGGFRCSVCGHTFEKKHESNTHHGMCYDDGYKILISEIRNGFENIETQHLPTAIELFDISFSRRGGNKIIELEHQFGDEFAALVDSLVLKIGDEYAELSVKIPDDPDEDDCKITLQLRGKIPPVREPESSIFRWKWPRSDKSDT